MRAAAFLLGWGGPGPRGPFPWVRRPGRNGRTAQGVQGPGWTAGPSAGLAGLRGRAAGGPAGRGLARPHGRPTLSPRPQRERRRDRGLLRAGAAARVPDGDAKAGRRGTRAGGAHRRPVCLLGCRACCTPRSLGSRAHCGAASPMPPHRERVWAAPHSLVSLRGPALSTCQDLVSPAGYQPLLGK
uniref:Uncharacterized protein n=1 Tax=Rousettus aegyptiacus TaxID=9407 RepID=A0A7J8B9A8_ROUAE|nr:hypothetical protein HJG63_009954 [Rousettus aegyptiacus]